MLPRKNYFRHVYGNPKPTVTNHQIRAAGPLKQKRLSIPDDRLKSIFDLCPKV
jgi:hypothetical protein